MYCTLVESFKLPCTDVLSKRMTVVNINGQIDATIKILLICESA